MNSQNYTIPFVKLATESKSALSKSILKEIESLVDSSQFILGSAVEKFEKTFAQICGTKYAIGVNSGLDALILSLRSLGIGPGDEVITAPNSFIASASAVALVGARPVFVDVDWDFNINVDQLKAAITQKTKAIIPVHLTGNPCRMQSLMNLASSHDLKVIEDAAQAIGAFYQEKPVGSLGDIGCFSLHPLKNLHVWGDGGMITTNNPDFFLNLKMQRNHGLRNRDESEFFSFNSRLDTLQAIVGNAYSEILPETIKRRTENAHFYLREFAQLGSCVKLPKIGAGSLSAWHVFQLWTKERDGLQQHLSRSGIETKIHYPIPLHLQPASKYLGYKLGDFPVCEALASGILSLPVRENLDIRERESIVESVLKFFQK